MKFKLEIDMGNAAFGDGDNGAEVSRILSELAEKINETTLTEADGGKLYDYNGNCVGKWEVTK